MSSLDKKHRPKTLNAFAGNTTVIKRLKSLLADKESFPSALLFQGPRGCGKTSLSRIIPKKLGISEILELNIGSQRGIDHARNLEDNVKYSSIAGGGKFIILDECHRGTVDFFNCLLKILEEPPPNVYFSLCTTNPEKLIDTIKSRTKPPFIVKKLTTEEMKTLVTKIARKEKIDISGSSIMRAILTASDGIPRDALLILNSIKSIDDPETMLEFIKDGSWDEDNKEVNELCQILLRGGTYKQTMEIVSKLDGDPDEIRRSVLNYMAKVLSGSNNPKAAIIISNFYESFWQVGKAGVVFAVWNCLNPTE